MLDVQMGHSVVGAGVAPSLLAGGMGMGLVESAIVFEYVVVSVLAFAVDFRSG
jgi:hypothetical protein